jgi:hypothetical protein
MLAEPIVVPDGDSFLQEPIEINAPGLPELPPLTYTKMARLQARLERLLVIERGLPESEPIRINEPGLPRLPSLDRAQMAQLQMHLERILKDP